MAMFIRACAMRTLTSSFWEVSQKMAGVRLVLLCSLPRLLILSVCVYTSVSLEEEGNRFQWPLYMPAAGHKPLKHNDYRCRASQLPQSDDYVVSYEPRADPNVAHHMLVYGCSVLRHGLQDSSSWSCKSSTVCGALDMPKIIYAWALNASGFQLPPGVGQKVGPQSDINFIVVQIHYGEIKGTDSASPIITGEPPLALVLHVTAQRQQRVSGVYLLGSSTRIPPGKEVATTDTACQFGGPKSIVPIAFRTHAHAHSTLIVGYVGDGRDNWREIGFRSPQDPQAFYPVNDGISVNPGDWLASRCVYNTSERTHSIHMGPNTEDEMCNFYIMYHTENDGNPLRSNDCWMPAPSLVHYPPLPTLPPSPGSHHHHDHSTMADGSDDDIDITLPEDKEKIGENEDDYMCPSSIPPAQVPSQCLKTTPINQPPQVKDKGDETQHLTMVPAEDWPYNGVDYPSIGTVSGKVEVLGQVTSVAVMTDGSVLVLHRGPRVWDYSTFSYTNIFVDAEEGPIATPTVLKFSSAGVLQQVWGAGMFYLPHSITVDHRDNIWITDVAMHQVFMFTGLETSEPSITLGHRLVPDAKPGYFCKPTDVAVSLSGTFYVADGYCNSRVVAYNANGMVKSILGNYPIDKKMLYVPHSLTLNPTQDILYVADRENKRIVSIEVSSGKVRVFSAERSLGHVFGIVFSGMAGVGGWPVIAISGADDGETGYGVTIGPRGDIETAWGVKQKFKKIHDLAVDRVNGAVYVTELSPPRIWKFTCISWDSSPMLDGTTLSVTEQPLASTEQPLTTTEQPPSTTIPTTTIEQPLTTTGQPSSTTKQLPTITTERPPTATEQPPSTTKQLPTTTTGQPPSTTKQLPTTTTGQPPSTTKQLPTIASEQPPSTMEQGTEGATTEHPNTAMATSSTAATSPTTSADTAGNPVTTSAPTTAPNTTSTLTTVEPHTPDNSSDSNSPATGPNASSGDDSSFPENTTAELAVGDKTDDAHSSSKSSSKRVVTPAYHYGLFAAIFAIVALILVVVIGILKEHRYCRFRHRRLSRAGAAESKTRTPRDTLHSLLGPSKLGFSRLRTYDSDSEVEEFPIFSRQT